ELEVLLVRGLLATPYRHHNRVAEYQYIHGGRQLQTLMVFEGRSGQASASSRQRTDPGGFVGAFFLYVRPDRRAIGGAAATRWRAASTSPVPASPCRAPPESADTCVPPSVGEWRRSTGCIPIGFPAPD